jgi:predicted nuclease with TOPRIM domain
MKDLAMKYLERFVLDSQSKSELINKIMELQERDKEWFDKYSNLYKAKKESEKRLEERIKEYSDRMEEVFNMHTRGQVITEEYKRLVDLKLGNTYNINATWIDKIVFVLKAAGRPMRSSEIIDVLLKNDMTFRTLTDHQKGLSAHLTKALKYGRIIGEKQAGQNGYLYSLPTDTIKKSPEKK